MSMEERSRTWSRKVETREERDQVGKKADDVSDAEMKDVEVVAKVVTDVRFRLPERGTSKCLWRESNDVVEHVLFPFSLLLFHHINGACGRAFSPSL